MGRSARGPRGSLFESCGHVVFTATSRRPGAMSVKKSLVQRREVERALHWLQTQRRQVRQRACAPWADRRISTGRSARGPCATGFESFDYVDPKPQPSTWRSVGEEESRQTALGGARPALAAQTTTPSPAARACSMGGWPVLHGVKRAQVARHQVRQVRSPIWRGVGEVEPRPTAWGGVRPALASKPTTLSPPAQVLCGRSGGSPRGEARASCAARHSEDIPMRIRSRSCRPGEVALKCSLGQRRGIERAPR